MRKYYELSVSRAHMEALNRSVPHQLAHCAVKLHAPVRHFRRLRLRRPTLSIAADVPRVEDELAGLETPRCREQLVAQHRNVVNAVDDVIGVRQVGIVEVCRCPIAVRWICKKLSD